MRLFLRNTKISIILLKQMFFDLEMQATPAIYGEHTLVVHVRED